MTNCCLCKKVVKCSETLVTCCFCGNQCHTECAGIPKQVYRFLSEREAGKQLKWHCSNCSSASKSITDIVGEMEIRFNEKLELMRHDLVTEMNKAEMKLAHVAQSTTKPTPKKSYAVVLKSTTASATVAAEEVAPILETEQVVHSRPARGGGLVLKCPSRSAADRVAQCVQANRSGIVARVPQRTTLSPKITVANIPSDSSPETILSAIRRKNPTLTNVPENELRLLFITNPRRGRIHAVLAVSPSVRSTIKRLGDRLFLGLRVCDVFDRFWVARCSKCAGLGHKAATCDRSVCCGHCSGPHLSSACESSAEPKCTNCRRAGRPHNHSSFSSDCASFISALLMQHVHGRYFIGRFKFDVRNVIILREINWRYTAPAALIVLFVAFAAGQYGFLPLDDRLIAERIDKYIFNQLPTVPSPIDRHAVANSRIHQVARVLDGIDAWSRSFSRTSRRR